ncbi:MAG: hypothetical protein Q9212_001369 [Teloschistes hypoglaucus]
MPRTFKFSFPLPGRKASDDKNSSPGAAITPNDSHDNSPFSDPGSKAERILGTMDLAPNPDKSSKASRRVLRKKPSFMSVTISEAESDSAAAKDGFPFPGMSSSRGSSRRPSLALRNQPSSPLLGDRFPKDSPGTDSMTDNSSPRPHFYGSSSTLRSYYDPTRSPLSISQQTSASSARDMALRKGLPSISSPLSQDVSEEISPSAVGEDQRQANKNPRGKGTLPSNMSDPCLLPNSFAGPILSPDQVPKSPSQLSYSSSPQSGSTGRPNWWKRRKAKESKTKEAKLTTRDARSGEGDFGVESLKRNIKKPRAGTQHWFDSGGTGNDPDPRNELIDANEVHGEFWNQRLNNLRHDTDDIPNAGPVRDDRLQSGDDSISLNFVKSAHLPTRQNSQNSQTKDSSSQTNQVRTRSRSLNSAKADLLNQSFLELSSSSDDESGSAAVQEHEFRRPRIRDSIDRNYVGEDVLITKAERIRPVKPKPILSTSPRRSKRELEVIPPVPKIPERPQLQQRVSSMRWRESVIAKSPGFIAPSIKSTTSSNGDASLASHASSSRPIAFEVPIKKFAHGSRLMTVTVEESELLEAMRQKRANRAHSDLSSPNHIRPKTAGATTDGRGSYIGSDLSCSPAPSLPSLPDHSSNNYSIHNGPHSPFRFPEVPLELPTPRKTPKQAPPIVFPPPKSSPTESFSPSDLLPSTPRSRLSPLTPPPSQEVGKGMGRGRHERKRTMSSGVVMVDDEEVSWAYGREERW